MADDPSIPIIDIDDLRPGDIVLLTAARKGKKVDPIGRSVELFDATDYSHAVVLEHFVSPRFDFTCLSANQRQEHEGVDVVASGVNRLSLRWLNSPTTKRDGRGLLVLRHPNKEFVAAALAEGPCWVDTPNRDPSDFGWEQIGLSAAYSWSRHLDRGVGRWMFQKLVREISTELLPEQRPDGDPRCGPEPGDPPQRWDCCHFVDHLFSAKGRSLGTMEVDPDPQGDPWALLAEFIDLWQGELFRKLCERKVEAAVNEAELDRFVSDVIGGDVSATGFGPVKEFVRALLCIRSIPLPTVADAVEPLAGTVWPPFSTPRLLWQQAGLEIVGIIPPGRLDG